MKGKRLLRKWRKNKGFTQIEAADFLGFTQGCYSEYENGEVVPRIPRARTIANKTRGAVPVQSWGEA